MAILGVGTLAGLGDVKLFGTGLLMFAPPIPCRLGLGLPDTFVPVGVPGAFTVLGGEASSLVSCLFFCTGSEAWPGEPTDEGTLVVVPLEVLLLPIAVSSSGSCPSILSSNRKISTR